MLHVAILKPGYIRDILAGRKTIESRLTKTNQPPHGRIVQGERLFLKASGGPFMAMATAGEVLSWENLGPADYKQIERRYRAEIGGDDVYWDMKRSSRFATLIRLREVEPLDVGPRYKVAYMKAWYVLDDALNPVRDVVLTGGAIRNRYAALPKVESANRQKQSSQAVRRVELELPDGGHVKTDLATGRMLRWRGWGPIYDAADAEPGDKLRFIAVGPSRYKVSVIKQDGTTP